MPNTKREFAVETPKWREALPCSLDLGSYLQERNGLSAQPSAQDLPLATLGEEPSSLLAFVNPILGAPLSPHSLCRDLEILVQALLLSRCPKVRQGGTQHHT